MSFSKDIEKWASKTKQDVRTVLRSISLSMGSDLIILSPVDTGRFRSNWRFQVGAPDLSTVLEGKFDKSPLEAQGKLKVAIDGFEIGDIIYFTNNLDYAVPLEFGHSEQRPEGMVRVTAAKYQKYVKNAIKQVKK